LDLATKDLCFEGLDDISLGAAFEAELKNKNRRAAAGENKSSRLAGELRVNREGKERSAFLSGEVASRARAAWPPDPSGLRIGAQTEHTLPLRRASPVEAACPIWGV